MRERPVTHLLEPCAVKVARTVLRGGGKIIAPLPDYHRILRCFVLLDLKMGQVKHLDIGQMNMYLGYFAHEENVVGDNPPIGIILSKEKDELLVQYATYKMDSQLFVAKYQLYLPEKEELRKQLEKILAPL